ncbi:hypothetical protein [Pontimicrobium sp. SW4]|uniref:HMA domain-containing protein n=1 Tax=Pontimicrobium sp. SW4 TaxID=3153519 RepID=A0AAU7BWQ0_9FLAO
MKLLIFRTDIETKKNIKAVKSLFKFQSSIINWSIDIEDVDKVLKVKATEALNENDIKTLIKARGFQCEPLPD